MTAPHLVVVPAPEEQTDLERLLLASLNARGVAAVVNQTLDAIERSLEERT